MSPHKSIALVVCALVAAQVFHLRSDFAEIDTAEKLIEQYERPTLAGVGLFIVCGLAASVMAFFRANGWRLAIIVVVGLYAWAIWYPDFLHLVFKYGASTVIAGIYDQARAAGTLGSVLLHNVVYPLGFSCVLLWVLWDLGGRGGSD
jgi:hypothetical protein